MVAGECQTMRMYINPNTFFSRIKSMGSRELNKLGSTPRNYKTAVGHYQSGENPLVTLETTY